MFLVQGAQEIASVLKCSETSAATTVHVFFLKHIFGMPDQALKLYASDDSGCHTQPQPSSNVKPEDRIDYITHQALSRFLAGPGLKPFFNRFTEGIILQLRCLRVGGDWIAMEDLWTLFQSTITPAALEAMCGSDLLALVPTFAEDLWAYDSAIPDLVRGLPRWWVPGSYAKRDKMLRHIKNWHAFAKSRFHESHIGPDGDWDPHFGSEFMRSRQKTFPTMNGMTRDAMAASDLGAIWA